MVSYTMKDSILPIIQLIFVDLFWLTYPIFTVLIIVIFFYRDKIISSYRKRMLIHWENMRKVCDCKIRFLKEIEMSN